jgi:hypothetical protein
MFWMSARRPYVPESPPPEGGQGGGSGEGSGEGRGESAGGGRAGEGGKEPSKPRRGGPARPYVPGAGQKPEPAPPPPEPGAAEPGFIDLNLDELLSSDEVPAVLSGEGGPETGPATRPPEQGSPLYGVAEELVRMRRQLELRKLEAQVLHELQDEADSPAARDLVEAAFAAGYFAAKGELERRIDHAR